MKRIALAFVHGVALDDPDFAEAMERRLRARLSALLGGQEGDEVLVTRSVHWSPVVEHLERSLLRRLLGEEAGPLYDALRKWIQQVNRGSALAILPILLSALPGGPGRRGQLSYAALRWLLVHLIGDAIAYQATPSSREVYDAIHTVYARALRELAEEAGPTAPLCVVSHSLGTIISSNHFYDLQEEQRTGRKTVASSVSSALRGTPLEWGETLTLFYTLGSPLALWTLRYRARELDRPIAVPSPQLRAHHPALSGEWINLYDSEDVIASPLKNLSPSYRRAVTQDREVRAGPRWLSWTPLAHPYYWTTDSVVDAIAHGLAQTWRKLNPG